jgi:hypothetical protein
MWTSIVDHLEAGRVCKIAIERAGERLSCASVLGLWQRDAAFRAFFMALLAEAPFAAYLWECPPVSVANAERAFEFVVVDSPSLACVPADERAFAAQFAMSSAGDGIATFWNLGRDALLVAPCPLAPRPPIRTSPRSRGRHRLSSSTRCGARSARRSSSASPPSPSGSARPAWASTGCTSGWIHGRNTTASGRIDHGVEGLAGRRTKRKIHPQMNTDKHGYSHQMRPSTVRYGRRLIRIHLSSSVALDLVRCPPTAPARATAAARRAAS